MADDGPNTNASGEVAERPFSLYVVNQFVDEELQCIDKSITAPFQSLEGILRRPAYLTMFLKHLHETQGPEATIPLLFVLRVGAYYHSVLGVSDSTAAKRQAQSIVHTFLSQNAPWLISLDTASVEEVVDGLVRKTDMTDTETANLFNTLIMEVAEMIASQLDAYQQSLKAEDDAEFLQEDIDQANEYQVTEKILSSLVPPTAVTAQDGSYVMLLTSAAMSMGIDAKSAFQKISNVQRGSQSGVGGTVATAASMFKVKPKHQVHVISGHNFVATHYNSPTFCDFCNGLLWGIGNQGYTCQLCGYNVHKATCNQSITEYCRGEPREGTASIFRRGSLRPSFSGSFRQGLRPTQSRSSVEEEGGGGVPKRRLSSMASTSTLCSESTMCDMGDRQASADRGSNFYNLRRAGGGTTRSDSDRTTGNPTNKILRAQSMKVSNNAGSSSSEKPKQLAAQRDSISASRRSIDGMLEGQVTRDETVSATYHRAFKDPDLAVDEDLIPWSIRTEQVHLSEMSKEEIKRQDLIHELVHTEQTHVKKLKVLLHVFYTPLMSSDIITQKMVDAMFPGLSELTDLHVDVMNGLKKCLDPDNNMQAKEVGEVLVQFFSGEKSEQMQETASEWVKLRQMNLDFLKQFSTKNPKLGQLITQCEANPMCTRLKLPDLTSVIMQRFTKYPLLLESILKKTSSEKCPQEYENLAKAVELSRRILARINQDVMEFENNRSMFELQNRIDFKYMDKLTGSMSVYRTLDISNRELLHRDELKARLKGKLTSVDALLFPDILVLLEHNEDKSRYYLRIREESIPIITLKDLLPPREVASDKERKSFLLVWLTSSGSRMYELAASTSDASATWRIRISDAIAASKGGTSSPTSQSYAKNIKSYMLRAQTRYRSMSSQDVVDNDLLRAEDGVEETCISPKSSLDNLGGKYLDDLSAVGSPIFRGESDHEKPEKHAFRSAVIAATTFVPRGAMSSKEKSPTSSPAVERKAKSSPTNLTAGGLVSALEHCVTQVQGLTTLAQETTAKAESISRTRSIRNRNTIQTSDSSGSRLLATIDTLRTQLMACVDLAKENAVAFNEMKDLKDSLEADAASAAIPSVTSLAMLTARGLPSPNTSVNASPSASANVSVNASPNASVNASANASPTASPTASPVPSDFLPELEDSEEKSTTAADRGRSSRGNDSVSSLGSETFTSQRPSFDSTTASMDSTTIETLSSSQPSSFTTDESSVVSHLHGVL